MALRLLSSGRSTMEDEMLRRTQFFVAGALVSCGSEGVEAPREESLTGIVEQKIGLGQGCETLRAEATIHGYGDVVTVDGTYGQNSCQYGYRVDLLNYSHNINTPSPTPSITMVSCEEPKPTNSSDCAASRMDVYAWLTAAPPPGTGGAPPTPPTFPTSLGSITTSGVWDRKGVCFIGPIRLPDVSHTGIGPVAGRSYRYA